MAKFPFITDSIHGDVPINFYPVADMEKEIVMSPSPGLATHCALTSCSQVRGAHAWNGYVYVLAQRGSQTVLWRVDEAGGFSEVGTITTSATGPVWMKNNLTQLCMVDGVSGYIYTPSTGHFVQITDLAFPGASSMDYQDGYGIFTTPNSNQWFFSAINDFSSFDAGDFYTKEGRPDKTLSVLTNHREPCLFASDSVEVWYNAGGDNTSVSTPTFARNTGGLIEFGCVAAKSPANFNNSTAWLSDKRQLLSISGYNPQIFSSDKFGKEVSGYSKVDDAFAFSYTDLEHEFYQITFPTADTTWVYDAKTKLFHKKQSWKSSGGFGRHRAYCHTVLNGVHYVGDYANGKVYKMSVDYLDESGEEIQRVLHTPEIPFFPTIEVEFTAGVGLESGLDPQVMLQFSTDMGKTWSNELWRSVGKIGEYGARAVWNRMGFDLGNKGRMYRLTMTDPVFWQVQGLSGSGKY